MLAWGWPEVCIQSNCRKLKYEKRKEVMKIAIGSDHAGFEYKEKIRQHLSQAGHEVKDFGTYSSDRCDYPTFIRPVAVAVAAGQFERGIVLGATARPSSPIA